MEEDLRIYLTWENDKESFMWTQLAQLDLNPSKEIEDWCMNKFSPPVRSYSPNLFWSLYHYGDRSTFLLFQIHKTQKNQSPKLTKLVKERENLTSLSNRPYKTKSWSISSLYSSESVALACSYIMLINNPKLNEINARIEPSACSCIMLINNNKLNKLIAEENPYLLRYHVNKQ